MSTNLTIDDSSPDIIYSSDWALQSSEDPQADQFFQSTYHSAQSDGSCANLTFTGSAIYLYGTKGPGHANYSVQFDSYITFSSASDAETQYQQPLFGYTFNTSGVHFVEIKSIHADSNKWFDLDYITITVNEADSNTTVTSPSSSAPAPTASQSISPPWLSESSSTAGSSPSSSTSGTSPTSSSSASSSTSKTTLVLSIVFGSAIIAALIFALGFFFARRSKRRRDHQQMIGVGSPRSGAFSSYKPPPSPSLFGGGPLSPMSADLYTAHSPASRTDPFHSQLSPGPDPDIPHAPVRTPGLDGRYSPYSALSMGGATVLTAASTAYLLNPQFNKAGDQLPKQIETDSAVGLGVGVGAELNRSPRLRESTDLPIYKKHRLFDSDTALRALRGGGATALGLTRRLSGIPVKGTDGDVFDIHAPSPIPTPASGQTRVQAQPGSDYDKPRPAPIPPPPPPPPLHACHRSESDISSDVLPPPPPRRPKRPGDGLLDFIGSSLAQKLERSASAKRRKDDGNSERTNFLKV